MSLKINKQQLTTISLPLVADGLALTALLLLVPAWSMHLSTPAGSNAFWLAVIYTGFLVGVYLLRKLEEAETAVFPAWFTFWLQPRVRGALALLFSLFMVTGLAYQLGYFDIFLDVGQETVGEGESAALFVFGPGAWLLFAAFYILVLAFPVRANVAAHSPRRPWINLYGLLAIDAMMMLATAQIRALLPDGRFLWLLPIFLLLIVLFAPPRLLHARNQGNWRTLIPFLVLLAACTAAAMM